jgi:hypothetical protein
MGLQHRVGPEMPFRDSETALGVVAVAPGGGVARRGQNAPVDSPVSLRSYKICVLERRFGWTCVCPEGSSGTPEGLVPVPDVSAP